MNDFRISWFRFRAKFPLDDTQQLLFAGISSEIIKKWRIEAGIRAAQQEYHTERAKSGMFWG
ncbi:hypothetical protein [Paenibacillus sp. Y412MC10]|uniref:hypothetical protein n=1 Tax=Geobacillus sp. (strain Y412MC10) TaxID=481743 RepID=UPI0011A271E0|nr:hypothetical protein [Paenibacillus sp. Y412MC10]